MPGVREVLPRITLPMAVWANTKTADEAQLRDLLRRAQILEFFSSVVTSVDAGFRKPQAEFFRFALGRWVFAKKEILFVGNQLNTDVAGAAGYGISTAWLSGAEFRSADETATLEDVKPTFILHGFEDVPDLLQQIQVD